MNKKIKKTYNQKKTKVSFSDIDAKLLNGWQCQHLTLKQKEYFERIKLQTQLAMENKRFSKTFS
tara:strand:+ start:377 stop:568 length:192 start_codon:yes stop_codon:yes gene_type:complete